MSKTLLKFGANPENGLGGKLGFISLLHTWDRLLNNHFHLHCLVPGGALADDRNQWILCKNDFLFSIQALSPVFRGKYIYYLKKAYENNELLFPGKTAHLGTTGGFKALVNSCFACDWVVDIRDPIEQPEYVLEYLARYTHSRGGRSCRKCLMYNIRYESYNVSIGELRSGGRKKAVAQARRSMS